MTSTGRRSGFTLLETIIGIGVAMIGILGIMQMIDFSQKSQKSVTHRISFELLRTSIKEVLDNPNLCSTAFRHQNGAGPSVPAKFGSSVSSGLLTNIEAITSGGTVAIAAINQKIEPTLTLTQLALKYQKDVNGTPVPPLLDTPSTGKQTHYVELHVEATPSSSSQVGSPLLSNKTSPFRLAVVTDASSEIIQCGHSGFSTGKVTLYKRGISYDTGSLVTEDLGLHEYCSVYLIGQASNHEANYTCAVLPENASNPLAPEPGSNPGGTAYFRQELVPVVDPSGKYRWKLHARCWNSCHGFCGVTCYD